MNDIVVCRDVCVCIVHTYIHIHIQYVGMYVRTYVYV